METEKMKRWGKNIRSLKDSNDMVAEIVGTVVLLGITVAFFSTLYVIALSYPFDTSEPNPTIVATVEGKNIIFEHRGGNELSLETKIVIDIGNETFSMTAGELLIDSNGNDKWNIGEKLAYQFNYSLNLLEADVISIDVGSNKVILLGTLDIHPECDIGIEIMVEEKYLGTPRFIITATNYRGDIDATVVKIKITLPDDLIYRGYFTTQGDYNPITGIWNVDNLPVGDFVILKIYMWGKPHSGMTGVAELLSSTPMDINPANNKAYITYPIPT